MNWYSSSRQSKCWPLWAVALALGAGLPSLVILAADQARPAQVRRLPAAIQVDPGFDDDDDEESLPFLLDPAELQRRRIKPKTQSLLTNAKIAYVTIRALPVYNIRIHAVRTADSNGANAATITPDQISALVNQANAVYWTAGINFQFDPAKDFEHRNNTTLNQDYEYTGNLSDPNLDPDSVADLSGSRTARNTIAQQHQGKLVVFFIWGTKSDWDSGKKVWVIKPRAGGSSSPTGGYVNMPRKMPEKNLLAHEMGHYLHAPHTFVKGITTVADAAKAIKAWVLEKNHPTQQGLDVFDGDKVADTPPDTAGSIFIARYGEGANCDPKYPFVQIPVDFGNGYTATYMLKPDRLNVMSYFKGCHGLGTHHLSKGQIARVRDALTKGNRQHLLAAK